MAEVIWTLQAVEDVERIVAYIEIYNVDAASASRKRISSHVNQLEAHPLSGPVIPEMRGSSRLYRQLVEPPCRVFYRLDGSQVIVLKVIRSEMDFRPGGLLKYFREYKKSTSSEDSL